ncbi:MAG: phospho-sugar mutase, partial [Clostridiales bacterium]|nr:phospho-sugar mutase [Clostridiales bacterium]
KNYKHEHLHYTDPDCDRLGIAVLDSGDYTLMTGNEVGCLLLNYVLTTRAELGTLPEQPVTVKTSVTSDRVLRIAEKFGCEVREVRTGVKSLGEQIGLLEKEGHPERYVFGFEESYGYLSGTYVRDKDGVNASMLICEMAAYYKKQGKSLLDVLDALYAEFGVYRHILINAEFEGAEGMATMHKLMESLRENRPQEIAGLAVTRFSDYLASRSVDMRTGAETVLTLPKSNVLVFGLEDGAGVIVRPSGTEPKIKAYVTATGTDKAAAEAMAERLTDAAKELLKA